MQIKQSAVGVLADLCYSNCKEIVVMPVQGSRSLHKWYWFLAGFGNGTTYPQKFWWTINNWTGCNATYIRVLKITIDYWSFHWSTLEQRIQLNAQKLVKSVTTDQMWFCSMPLDCPREVCFEHLPISLCCLHIKCDNYASPPPPPLRSRGILLCSCWSVGLHVVIPYPTDNSRTLCPRSFKLGR